jgi:hypothetical protein
VFFSRDKSVTALDASTRNKRLSESARALIAGAVFLTACAALGYFVFSSRLAAPDAAALDVETVDAITVCQGSLRLRLVNPSGLVWSGSSAQLVAEQPETLWKVWVSYRAHGVSPRMSVCTLRQLSDRRWQTVDIQ